MYAITQWRKPKRSNGQGMCVEVGFGPGVVGTRDSKLGERSPVLAVSPQRWTAFLDAVKAGGLDR